MLDQTFGQMTLNKVGYYGPINLLVLIFLVCAPTLTPTRVLAIAAWQTLNYYSNVVLKNAFKEPRPYYDPSPVKVQQRQEDMHHYLTRHLHYGLPSGHAQGVFSECAFLLLYLHHMPMLNIMPFVKPLLMLLTVGQTALTSWQRHADRRHTWPQIALGGVVGSAWGVAFYFLYTGPAWARASAALP